jgi:hypothetical protein
MKKSELTQLKTRVKQLSKSMASAASNKELHNFLKIINNPGWTTPAEVLFVTGVVDAMLTHAEALGALKQVLVAGSRAVELKENEVANPQCRGLCAKYQNIVDAIQEASPKDIPRLLIELKAILAQIARNHCVCVLE